MGVRTTADEKLEQATDCVDTALKALNAIVVDQCYGHEDLNLTARETVKVAHRQLLDIRDALSKVVLS